MSESQHTIAGTVLTMPVRVRKADVHTAMFSVDADAAQRLIDHSGLKVCRHRPGRAIVNLMLARYFDGDLGKYNEFGVSVMVNPPGSDARGSGGDPPRNPDFLRLERQASGRRQVKNGERPIRCRAVTKFSCRGQVPEATLWPPLLPQREFMLKTRLLVTVAASLALVTGASARLLAQGVTTGAVSGTVTDQNGNPVEGAQIQIRNPRTGFSSGGITRANGQYSIQGVEPDAGYSVTARRIGFEPVTRANRTVTLGQAKQLVSQIHRCAHFPARDAEETQSP